MTGFLMPEGIHYERIIQLRFDSLNSQSLYGIYSFLYHKHDQMESGRVELAGLVLGQMLSLDKGFTEGDYDCVS